MPGAVLFDLDGVLVQSDEVWFRLLNAAAEAFGAPPISRSVFQSAIGQGVEADVERFFPGATVEAATGFYESNFLRFSDHLEVEPGAPAVLDRLRERGIGTAVVTNTPSPLAREVVGRAGLAPDYVVGAGDVPHPKPAPDMVLHACALLDASPGNALVVGDSEHDRSAAAAAAVPFVGLRTVRGPRIERLEEVLTHVDADA